jgi:hypothetical protein
MPLRPPRRPWTMGRAGCHTARALAVNTSGARRFELLACRCDRRARLLAQFYRVSTRVASRRTGGLGRSPSTTLPQSLQPAAAIDARHCGARGIRNSRGKATGAARLQDFYLGLTGSVSMSRGGSILVGAKGRPQDAGKAASMSNLRSSVSAATGLSRGPMEGHPGGRQRGSRFGSQLKT